MTWAVVRVSSLAIGDPQPKHRCHEVWLVRDGEFPGTIVAALKGDAFPDEADVAKEARRICAALNLALAEAFALGTSAARAGHETQADRGAL